VSATEPLVGGLQQPADLLLRDVHVLDPRAGIDARRDLRVRAGRIVELGEPGTLEPEPNSATDSADGGDGGDGAEELIEGAGRLRLLPAFFDPHVHLRTPGQEHKEDISTGTRAAAAGGFGAVIAMPNTDPVLDSAPLLRSLRDAAAREARVPVGLLPAITRGLAGEQLTEMAELRQEGALGFTDDGKPVHSAGMLRKALQYQRLCGGVLALHEEDPTLSRGGAMHEGAVSAALGIAGIPTVAESTMVARDAALAGYEDGRVHFQHLSCVASVEAVADAKTRGWRVSAEVCPHHLLLTEEDVRGMDTSMKMHPPLATEADRLALVEGLRAGTIDCVATDHAPHARHEKEVPFEQAPMGSTGLETAFAALHTGLVLPGILELGLLVERMTAGAALFELPTPTIAVGESANLTLVDLDAVWVAGEHGWESRSENCCFAGRRLQGRVLMTLAAGAIAHRDRALAMVGA
jgi:dihydroorotase